VDGPAPTGFVAQPSGGISQFVPTSLGSDTAAAQARMAAAFRSENAHLGGEHFSPSHPPPQEDSLVYTIGDVVFDGPWAGEAWAPGGSRTLFVEGRVEFRGQIKLDGWRVYAKGPVVVQDEAVLLHADIFSMGGAQIADRASVSGQILSKGSLLVSGRAALAAPTFAAVWPGQGADTVPRIEMRDRSSAQAYVVALGGASEIDLGAGVDFRGVAVSGGLLRVDGTLHGIGVSGRVDCGQPGTNCSAGNFDRPSLPADFAFPLGLPGNLGLRLVSWETAR
jgi:cytoskeletal protein CcmA (bactofilin family)